MLKRHRRLVALALFALVGLAAGIALIVIDHNGAELKRAQKIGFHRRDNFPVFAPRIVKVGIDSDYGAPFAFDQLMPTSAYQRSDGVTEVDVFAGSSGRSYSTGVLIRRVEKLRSLSSSALKNTFTYILGSGAITITGYKGDTVIWKGKLGKVGAYSLSTGRVTLR
jgi:hypothetical protein